MMLKKLIVATAMALVGMLTFSSCWFLVDQEKAIERISDVQPEKQVNRTVLAKDKMIIDIDGAHTEVDFLSEAKKHYTVGNTPIKGEFYRCSDWIYYEYRYDYNDALKGEDTMKVALMRSNIYTGETENLCDFGEMFKRTYSIAIDSDRYLFFYVQGLLKILDMETNQFTYEDCIEEESEIKQTLSESDTYGYRYRFYSDCAKDYVKDGKYYHYTGDGTYQELNVPDWIVAEEGTVINISLGRIENYVYTFSYKDIEEERKAYDLVEGAEVDYMTVVKPLKESADKEIELDYNEDVFVYDSSGVRVQVKEKNYKIIYKFMNYVNGSGTISMYELDEEGAGIPDSIFTIDGAYLKEHNEALQQLSKLWNRTEEGGLTCEGVYSSGGRVFFQCRNYYGTWLLGSTSATYLCELDPITLEITYLGYYTSRLEAMYVH